MAYRHTTIEERLAIINECIDTGITLSTACTKRGFGRATYTSWFKPIYDGMTAESVIGAVRLGVIPKEELLKKISEKNSSYARGKYQQIENEIEKLKARIGHLEGVANSGGFNLDEI